MAFCTVAIAARASAKLGANSGDCRAVFKFVVCSRGVYCSSALRVDFQLLPPERVLASTTWPQGKLPGLLGLKSKGVHAMKKRPYGGRKRT